MKILPTWLAPTRYVSLSLSLSEALGWLCSFLKYVIIKESVLHYMHFPDYMFLFPDWNEKQSHTEDILQNVSFIYMMSVYLQNGSNVHFIVCAIH